MRRRLLLFFVALLAIVVVAVATVPFWFGAATRAIGRSRGVTFSSYERIGYARFAFTDVVYRRDGVRVSVSRAEAPTPVLWLWRHWREQPRPIVAESWEVEVTKSTNPKPPSPDRGWMQLRGLLNRIATQLDRWLPEAKTGAGRVKFPGGEIAVTSAVWSERKLVASGLKYRELTADADVAFGRAEDVLRVNARTVDGVTTVALESRGQNLSGDVTWNAQRAALRAAFPTRGWLPTEASLEAQEWALPGATLKLGDVFALVRSSARIDWRDGRFAARVAAASEPVAGKAAPPLKVDFRGQGDAQAFTIEALQADIPGVAARLSEPVTVERSGALRGDGARLTLQADLAKQPWFTATGAVSGEARVVSAENVRLPAVEFTLAAKNVTAKDVNVASVDATGKLAWPRLEIARGALVAGEGERLEWRGGWDFKAKEILDASVEGQVRRKSVARWLPARPHFDVVAISARANGRVAEMEHRGTVKAADVVFRGVNPLALALAWQGRGIGAERFDAEAIARGSKVTAKGSATRDAVRLEALEFMQAGEPRLKLTTPAMLRWKPTLQLEGLQLAGPQGRIDASATMGERGKVELAAANISSRWFTDIVPEKGPAWQLTLLALMGTWDRGPMNFSLTAGASVEIGEGRTAAVNAAARGDKDALRIEALRVTEGDATVVNATGRLPVTVSPGTAELLRIDENGAVVLDATAAPNAAFWQKLAAVSGVELKEPDAVANVKGTWKSPEGTVSFKAARVAIDPKKVTRPLPTVEQIDVRVSADRDAVRLDAFSFAVEGQPVRASGRLPVPGGRWADLFKQPLEVARRGADLRLEVPEADVAVFSRFLPAVLAPKGRLEANVTFQNGNLGGFVKLRDAASKPLGPLGVLQEISADLEMSGRTLVLRGVKARSGGQPVALTGSVELPAEGTPRFDLALKGENLPFVRQTGLLLRGDLDLKLQTPESGPPRLNGVVRLRDSLFLSDVRSFLPQGGASASRRPPYFSVDTPPVNTWGLAVEVTGEKFMRLRTPVFGGVASARFRLSGTLGEPRAIGEIEIDEGTVRMPFARFEVQQGSVRLTESDPYEPAIYLRGQGQRYGYDLTLEIDGKASAPNVVFTSSPALESEQVLLMVMAGAAPRNDIAVTGTQRMTQLGTFVGQNLLSSFTSDGADADRLSIASGEKISRQGKETYDIEYKLSDKWMVTGEYNEFDEYNAGLKWRVFRGERKSETEKAEAAKRETENDAK